LVGFLGDLERSAKAGVPVYRLSGGAGFLWAATFDQNGKGVLRYLAIDDSKIEPSRQVASNSENKAESNSSPANPPVVTQPSLQQQSQSDAQAQARDDQHNADQKEEKRRVQEAHRQRKEAQQSSETQNRRGAPLIEAAIGSFVFLCGVAVAVFLRIRRRTAAQQ
jgi:cobalamin biosynthesis Mg chelatase CobN